MGTARVHRRRTPRELRSAGLTIPCVDTSCFFHSTDAAQRAQSLQMGRSMIDLAAALGAPGIRVFGDRVQPGADRDSTTAWIADGIRQLAEFAQPAGVEVWLESHGDCARASETMRALQLAGRSNTGVLWDPLNAYSEFAEEPAEGWRQLGPTIRHVHIKDALRRNGAPPDQPWTPVFVGDGDFPASSLVELLHRQGYQRFISLEWEKRWHPEIPAPEIALPRFMAWFRATLSAFVLGWGLVLTFEIAAPAAAVTFLATRCFDHSETRYAERRERLFLRLRTPIDVNRELAGSVDQTTPIFRFLSRATAAIGLLTLLLLFTVPASGRGTVLSYSAITLIVAAGLAFIRGEKPRKASQQPPRPGRIA